MCASIHLSQHVQKYRHPTGRNVNFVQHLDLGSLLCLTFMYQELCISVMQRQHLQVSNTVVSFKEEEKVHHLLH